MEQSKPEAWAESAQQLQQLFTQSWGKALQSFQALDLGAVAQGQQGPAPLSFSAPKLQELQQPRGVTCGWK